MNRNPTHKKIMKLIQYTAVAALLTGVANAQGLFNIAREQGQYNKYKASGQGLYSTESNQAEEESIPIRYNVKTAFGYDDNVNPTSRGSAGVGSTYLDAKVGASLAVRGVQTSWDLSATFGTTIYEDSAVPNDVVYNSRIAANINHRINDRVRVISKNFFNYGLDLADFYGEINSRQVEEYTYFSTDNSVGYRWTDRIGTYTGVSFSVVNYDGSVRDINSYAIYNQFRYMYSFQTTLTASTNYTKIDFDTSSNDRVTTSVGLEHRVTDTSTVVAKVGAQFGERNNAYVNLNYANKINKQFKTNVFVRYQQEDTDAVFSGERYEDQMTLRIGATASYVVSPKVTLTVGGNYSTSDYKDAPTNDDGGLDRFNIFAGANYMLNDALSLRASVNHSTSKATVIPNRDYDRNRYEFGVNYTF
jgi:hypothetical protein